MKVLEMDTINDRIWQLFLFKMSSQLDELCRKNKPSVLRSKITELDPGTFTREILQEMHRRCPRALDFLLTMCTSFHLELPEDCQAIAAIYAIAMHLRNPQLIGFQKLIGTACVRYNSANGVRIFRYIRRLIASLFYS